MIWRRLLGAQQRLGLAGLTAAAAATAILVGLVGVPKRDEIDLVAGSAWLPSAAVGQVTQLSGPSAMAMASVPVGRPGDDISVVQSGTAALAVDRTLGTVQRIDGATFELSQSFTFAPSGPGQLSVLVGGGATFVLDGAKGLLYRVDPRTLEVLGGTRELDAVITPGAAVVDDTGRLWVLDRRSGTLKWFDSDASGSRTLSASASSTLVLGGGRPILIQQTGAEWLARDGATANAVDFNLRPGETVIASGTPDGRLLAVIVPRGILELCTPKTCLDEAVDLPGAGHRLGPAVLDQGRIFVPDLSKGTVHVISNSRQIAAPKVLRAAGDLELTLKDTVLFYNDRSSDQAGVLQLDGSFVGSSKYRPKDPSNGLTVSTTSQTGPPVPPKTKSPDSLNPASTATSESLNPATTATPLVSSILAGNTSHIPITSVTSLGSLITTASPATGTRTSSTVATTPTTLPPTQKPPSGLSIKISSDLGVPYLNGDRLTFSAPTTGGQVDTWSWSAAYLDAGGAIKARSSGPTLTVTVDSDGAPQKKWTVKVTATNTAGSAESSAVFSVGNTDSRQPSIGDINVDPKQASAGETVTVSPATTGTWLTPHSCTWVLGTSQPVECSAPLQAPTTPASLKVVVTVVFRNGQHLSQSQILKVPAVNLTIGANISMDSPSGCSPPGPCQVALGTKVQVTAMPPKGTFTSGWNSAGPCASVTQSVCTFSATLADDGELIEAIFVALQSTLAINVSPPGEGTVTNNVTADSCPTVCGITVGYGTKVILTAHANPGFDVPATVGWSNGQYTATVGTQGQVDATFVEQPGVLAPGEVTDWGTGINYVPPIPHICLTNLDTSEGATYETGPYPGNIHKPPVPGTPGSLAPGQFTCTGYIPLGIYVKNTSATANIKISAQ